MTWDEIISLISLILFAVGLWWIFFGDDVKELVQMFSKKKKNQLLEEAINKVNEPIKDDEKKEEAKREPEKPVEEWIWVKGYKGTDKDMKCRDYQYELHKCFDISDDKEVVECEHGFHLCKDRNDVFKYYPIRDSNRFFEVKALVRKTDYESYNGGNLTYDTNYRMVMFGKDKLVAKSIIFTRELTVDEILSDIYVPDGWSAEDKKMIIELGYEEAFRFVGRRELNKLGYSDTFSEIIIKDGKFDIARAVGTQEGLSMDMKVWAIYNHQGQSKHR